MTRLLVTGGAGFIGANFVRWWRAHHPDDRVVVLDALTYAGNLANLEGLLEDDGGPVRFVHGDIGDRPLVERLLGDEAVDVVVHFAAESHNSLAVVDPTRFFATNVLGTQQLLEAARTVGVERFHHVSTCEVYGDLPLGGDPLDQGWAFTEASPYLPHTPYSASKAGADHAVRAYHQTYGLPVTITNCANNYGPFQFPEKVLPLFITRALDDRPLPVYASSGNRREWVHVSDHCAAIDAVLSSGRDGATYHVGTGEERSVSELADAVLELVGKPAGLRQEVPDRPGHDRRYVLDSSRLRHEMGWEPAVRFEEGLAATVAWYTGHREWWEPLLARSPVDEDEQWE